MQGPHIARSFICVTDIQGMRHALRLSSVTAIRDADEDRTETLIVINGGRASILIPYSMESVLDEVVEADLPMATRAGMRYAR